MAELPSLCAGNLKVPEASGMCITGAVQELGLEYRRVSKAIIVFGEGISDGDVDKVIKRIKAETPATEVLRITQLDIT
jgi:hypothetical protein